MLLNFDKWYKFFDRTVVGIPGALQGTGKVTNLLIDPLRESSGWTTGNFWFKRKDDIWHN